MVDRANLTRERQRHARHVCPRCGAPVYKVHRTRRDKLANILRSVRRYSCRAPECGWQGLIERPRDAASLWVSIRHTPALWFFAGMLAALSAVLLVWLYLAIEDLQPAPIAAEIETLAPLAVAAGVSLAGEPLEADEGRLRTGAAGMELRQGCVWGGPGELPFHGTLGEALTAAQLPGDIVGKFVAMRDDALVGDRVELSSAGIRSASHRRHFSHTMKAMALERALCFNTRINFPAGVTTTADLYELVDAAGERYAIMVVPHSGNVAVLEERLER